jgi:nucleotide-binding universal stress UspA family protein
MKQILVPTDFSDYADYAVDAAIAIAQKSGAEVILLHGVFSRIDNRQISNYFNEQHVKFDSPEEALLSKKAYVAGKGIAVHTKLVLLDNYKSLAHAVLEVDCDLIVMGSQGVGALRKLFAGSNSSRILGSANQPVLVVKEKVQLPCSYKTIVFASNMEGDTHPAFENLLQFGKIVGAENFHLVEITTPQNFQPTSVVKTKMENFISKLSYKSIWLHQYNHYTVEAGIAEFAQRIEADLIAIANHGRGDISSLFIESIPENLLKYSTYPVLSIRV